MVLFLGDYLTIERAVRHVPKWVGRFFNSYWGPFFRLLLESSRALY